jgi:undecaprenyl-diphosphatase
MSLFEAIVLGIVQGLTEFLPISSSAHLIVVRWLFGWDEPSLAFDAALHLGTLVAVVAYFWRDLLAMLFALPTALAGPGRLLRDPEPSWPRTASPMQQQARLVLLIAVGTIPGFLTGLFGQGTLESFFRGDDHQDRAIAVIAVLLILMGLLMLAAERTAAHQRSLQHLTWRDALSIGFAQATALVPGVSRSGATITAGLFQGLQRADAARFSFLLGTPLIFAGSVKAVADAIAEGLSGSEALDLLVGGMTSAAVGFLAIWWLLRYLQRASTMVFVGYRIGLGVILIFLVLAGAG